MVNYKKSLGIAICSFFGVLFLVGIIQTITNKLGLYNPSISPIIWIFQDIVCCISMGYIALNKVVRPALPGRIGAITLAALFAIFAINLLMSYENINIFSILGQYSSIIICVVEIVAAALLFYHIKVWLPVKISALIYWIPCLCSSFYFSKMMSASEIVLKTDDWTFYEKITNAIQICDSISLTLAVLTIVLTVIWMGKKPDVSYSQSNSIEII